MTYSLPESDWDICKCGQKRSEHRGNSRFNNCECEDFQLDKEATRIQNYESGHCDLEGVAIV